MKGGGGIMIGSSDNSGGVVVGALACEIVAGSNLALCFDFFSLVELENASLWPLGPGNLVCAHGTILTSSELVGECIFYALQVRIQTI